MTTTQFLVSFYAAMAIAVVFLLARLLRRRRPDTALEDFSPASKRAGLAENVPVPASAARSQSKVSWTNRTLFGRMWAGNGHVQEPAVRVPSQRRDDLVFGSLTPTLAALLPDSEARRHETEAELKRAGYYQPHALENLAAIRYLGVILPLLLFGSLLLLVPRPLEAVMVGCLVVFMLAGWALPRLYVKSRAAERTHAIETALPDMLDMLHMCVSQGLTIQAALKRVSRDMHRTSPALATELAILSEQAEIGTLLQSLENLGRRVDIPEVQAFVALLSQTESLGTSISAALMDYSDTMRESLRQRADQKANQASFKLLFPTVLCLMPAVYIFLLGPAIVELTDFFGGSGQQLLDTNTQTLENYNIQVPR